MARETRWGLEWEKIARALTAWELVRSSPDYRRDWAANKAYVKFWQSRPQDERSRPYLLVENNENTPAAQTYLWLKKLGQKWDFSSHLLTDPELDFTLFDLTKFRKGAALFEQGRRAGLAKRANDWLSGIRTFCPYSHQSPHGVFLQWPYRPWAERRPSLWKKYQRTQELHFDARQRGAGRIVLWVTKNISRQAVRADIETNLEMEWKKLSRRGLRNSRRVIRRGVVRSVSSAEFLVLSVDGRASKRQVWREISPRLRRFENLPKYEARLSRLWEGLRYYRETLSGISFRKICEQELGRKAWRYHQCLRTKEGARFSLPVRRLHDCMKDAKQLVKEQKFRSLIPSQNALISWERLSPQEPPVLPSRQK